MVKMKELKTELLKLELENMNKELEKIQLHAVLPSESDRILIVSESDAHIGEKTLSSLESSCPYDIYAVMKIAQNGSLFEEHSIRCEVNKGGTHRKELTDFEFNIMSGIVFDFMSKRFTQKDKKVLYISSTQEDNNSLNLRNVLINKIKTSNVESILCQKYDPEKQLPKLIDEGIERYVAFECQNGENIKQMAVSTKDKHVLSMITYKIEDAIEKFFDTEFKSETTEFDSLSDVEKLLNEKNRFKNIINTSLNEIEQDQQYL